MAWMALIFTASSDSASGPRSSRLIGPILQWLYPGISAEGLDFGVTLVRKCAHMTEYGVLALLVWWALRRSDPDEGGPWSPGQAWAALGVACVYAATDELHQAFVPNREGSVRDVVIDACGAALGLLALWGWRRWRIRAVRPNRCEEITPG